MKTCFLEDPFVVMLTFSLTEPNLLIILLISTIFLDDAVGNTFLIWIMSSTLVFEVCTYNFLLLMRSVNLLMFNLAGLEEEVDLRAFSATGMKCNETHWQNVLFLSTLRQF